MRLPIGSPIQQTKPTANAAFDMAELFERWKQPVPFGPEPDPSERCRLCKIERQHHLIVNHIFYAPQQLPPRSDYSHPTLGRKLECG